MLDIKKYIGKICLKDESKHLGTGFLIDKNKLITAKHVFINNNISDEDEKNIKIYFKEVEEQVKEVGIIKIIKHENRDIVIIELNEEMDEYFKMDVSDFHSGEKFNTFGYSARKKTYGEKIYGQILIEDFKNNEQYDLDLHCPDFPALNTKMFKGISGAPIISDKNYVKGMIIKKPDGTESFAGIKFSKLIDFLKFNNVEVNALGGNIPKVDNKYINRKKYEKDIIELLSKKKIVQVYGLSGIGKTQLVTQIINSEKNKFEKVYWIDIKDQNDGKIDLKKVIIFGKNKPINLEEIIKRYKTLIVIDNINNNAEDLFESFNNIEGNSSKLMITSLEKVFEEEYTYKIDYLTLEEAYKLFEKEKLGEIKSGVLKSFLNEIDRHPLLLRLIISLLKRDKNLKLEDIQNDYKNIHKIKDKNKNLVFFKRIVGRYIYDYEEILSHITTINNLFIEKSFMKKFGIIELEELISACIVNDNNTYYYYVHKIVLNSLKEILKENKYILEFKEVLKAYLEKKLDIRDIYYFKFLYNHIELIDKLFKTEKDDYMKVLLCNTIANYKNQDKFLDEVIKSIDNLELDYTRYYDIKLFSEKLEFEVRKLKKKDKKEGISEKIEQLKKILNINLDEDIKNILLIKHHIGKFYVWIQEYNEAEKIFVEIKNVDSEAYSSVLQLCRIYKNLASNKKIKYDEKKKFIDKGKENIKYILDGNNQPITVLLSAYELISKKPFYAKELIEEYLNKRFEEFGHILKESINNEFDQTYLVLKEFSGWLSYNKPNFYKNLLEYLEPPAYIKENKKLLLAYGQIYSKEFSRKKYHKEEFDKELNIAETYLNQYISMIEFDREKFNFKFLIDLYLESNKFKEADELINEIYDSENPYHLKWKCIIYRDRNDFKKDLDKSLQLIEKAIDIIEQISNKGKYYMAAFYNEYADTLKAIDDSKCIQTLKKALTFKKEISGNLKRDWTKKLEEWEKEFD